MKNKLILRMYVILLITVLIIAGGVFATVFVLSYSAMVEDIQGRAIGVKDFIMDSLYAEDLTDVGEDSPEGIAASLHIQGILERLRVAGNLSRLYVAKEDEAGEIITTTGYMPGGALEADLRLSLREGIAVMGEGIYHTDTGAVYTIFWPVRDQGHQLVGVVCMEFDANIIYSSHRQAAVYSLGLSGAMFILISVIAYLSMSRVTESTYKKLAYTDILTGYENRMAFEHRLRECGDLAEQGKNVALIICDVNNLKTINDTIGHKAGDAYIKNTADLIFDNLGGKETLYRIGGDEFAAIITERKENEIEKIMESLRKEKRPAYKTQAFSCGCGAATFTKGVDENLKDTFKRADEAMYIEKKRLKGLL